VRESFRFALLEGGKVGCTRALELRALPSSKKTGESIVLSGPGRESRAEIGKLWLPPRGSVTRWAETRAGGLDEVTINAPLDVIPLFQPVASGFPIGRTGDHSTRQGGTWRDRDAPRLKWVSRQATSVVVRRRSE
jgi:hypothetical protein